MTTAAPEPAVAASYEPALEPVATYEQPEPTLLEPVAASYEPARVEQTVPVLATPAQPEPSTIPQPMVASVEQQPEPVAAAPAASAPESLDQRLAQLMKRMEETEELMRTLRKAG